MAKYKIAFLVSHPIQYFSPLFAKMSKNPKIDLTVYYCSDESIRGVYDMEFATEVKWNVPLLNGYKFKFLKNFSLTPSIFSGTFGLVNLGIVLELYKGNYHTIVIHGWSYFTHILAIVSAKVFMCKVMIRGETPLSHERYKPGWKRLVKRIFMKGGLNWFVDTFLYVGEENREFYKSYKIPDKKLAFAPYGVDNDRFSELSQRWKPKKRDLRKKFGFPVDKTIILFVGKLIPKKRPCDLLAAYHMVRSKNKSLIFVGEGSLREAMQSREKSDGVFFTGFQNQKEIPYFYALADVFVLPSGLEETWGLVVNEAMNFGLPVIVSDMVGCSKDLVKHGENGFVFSVGNIAQLTHYLEKLIENQKLRETMGEKSLEIIRNYHYDVTINGVTRAISRFHIKK